METFLAFNFLACCGALERYRMWGNLTSKTWAKVENMCVLDLRH